MVRDFVVYSDDTGIWQHEQNQFLQVYFDDRIEEFEIRGEIGDDAALEGYLVGLMREDVSVETSEIVTDEQGISRMVIYLHISFGVSE